MIFLFVLTLLQVKVPDITEAPKGLPVSGAMLDQRTNEVASLLRCPVCQGLSVADSPSTMAQDMKHQVREFLARGYTQEQILAYFERSYGQFVLLKPKFQGVSAMVWLLPIAALIFGAIVVLSKAKQLEHGPAPAPAPAPEPEPEPETDPYLARVRELVEKQ
ncbi:MAG TPA: cytochrome c-type biogenesis protein [Thermoanaerobaculia bacterium]|nr:cytochrome c-type biogenesis protein [Thermoanaerobaculia bacterium]